MDILIAASDSSPEDKARADFVCDGVNDEAVLQAAIDAAAEDQDRTLDLAAGNFFSIPLFNTGRTRSVRFRGAGRRKTRAKR